MNKDNKKLDKNLINYYEKLKELDDNFNVLEIYNDQVKLKLSHVWEDARATKLIKNTSKMAHFSLQLVYANYSPSNNNYPSNERTYHRL